jgi:hypothetical protein
MWCSVTRGLPMTMPTLLYAPSVVISLTPLDICNGPVEYDVSFHKVNANVKE